MASCRRRRRNCSCIDFFGRLGRNMQRNVVFKAIEPDRQIEKLIDQHAAKLEKNLKKFSPDLTVLRLFVECIPARKLYQLSLTLDVPGRTFAAREEQHDLKAGLRAAYDEIERQLKKYKESLRREHWKRPARREEFHRIEAQAASTEDSKRETFFSLI